MGETGTDPHGSSQQSETTVPEDTMPSSGLHGHFTYIHTWYTDINALTTFHTQKISLFKGEKKSQMHALIPALRRLRP